MLNIKFMGSYKKESQLLHGMFNPNSIKYDEPDSISGLFLRGFLISFPIFVIVGIFIYLKIDFDSIDFKIIINSLFISSIFSLLLSYIHELLHAICYPLTSVKELWIKPNEFAAFIYCNSSVSKIRFILICLCPNIILGILPLLLWATGCFGFDNLLSLTIIFCSILNLLSGVGDYFNVYLTLKQVPKDALVQNYGIHSYWYLEV